MSAQAPSRFTRRAPAVSSLVSVASDFANSVSRCPRRSTTFWALPDRLASAIAWPTGSTGGSPPAPAPASSATPAAGAGTRVVAE